MRESDTENRGSRRSPELYDRPGKGQYERKKNSRGTKAWPCETCTEPWLWAGKGIRWSSSGAITRQRGSVAALPHRLRVCRPRLSNQGGSISLQKAQSAAMLDAACCDDLRSALRSQVQRSPLSSFVFFQSQCGTFPVLLFPFLQQNKPFFPSLSTFEAGIRQANAPGACPVLSCFVQRARIIRTCVVQLITCVQRIKPHYIFSFFENLLYLCRNLIFS